MMKGVFSEELPKNCPPKEAQTVITMIQVYRLVKNNPPTMNDFRSAGFLQPLKETAGECRNRAISVWQKFQDCSNIRKLKMHKNDIVCKVILKENAGYIMERSINSHIDWWPFKDYQILEYCEAGIDYE